MSLHICYDAHTQPRRRCEIAAGVWVLAYAPGIYGKIAAIAGCVLLEGSCITGIGRQTTIGMFVVFIGVVLFADINF